MKTSKVCESALVVGTGKWRSGFPASPGWYNASVANYSDVLRWFDGAVWSHPADQEMTSKQAADTTKVAWSGGDPVYWRPLRKELRRLASVANYSDGLRWFNGAVWSLR